MIDEFEDFGKSYSKEYRTQAVSYVKRMMEDEQPYYLCMYAEDSAVAYELKGDKILRDIRFGGENSDIRGNLHNEMLGNREFIEGYILDVVGKHGGVLIVDASDFNRMWTKRKTPSKIERLYSGISMLLRSAFQRKREY